MQSQNSESSAASSDKLGAVACNTFNAGHFRNSTVRHLPNGEQETDDKTARPEPPLSTGKRPHEFSDSEDDSDRRVRARIDRTPQDRAVTRDGSKLSLNLIQEETQGIVRIMRSFAATTGQIVAFVKGAPSNGEGPSHQTITELFRGILSKLIPCVTKINDAKALGIEIVGPADLVDSSLQREGVFTIISSPYASSVPEPLECNYDDYFAAGDIFWDRVTEFAADPRLTPGEKVAPSSQGLVRVAYRLLLVTKVTSRNLWTAPGRLRGGKGVSNLNQDDHWMHAHLHNPDKGRLIYGRATGNDTPHHSLEFDPETRRRSQAVNENTHFCAVDAEPHRPTWGMVPAGRLTHHSRELFLDIKAYAHSSTGDIVVNPLGMDLIAVQRGLQSTKRVPHHNMPLPNHRQRRDHLYNQLDTYPSLHGPEKLLRESSVFSSTHSESNREEGAQSPVASTPVISSMNDRNLRTPPQTVSPTTPHLRQQAPVQASIEKQKDRDPEGKNVKTTSADQEKVTPYADTELPSSHVVNQPSVTTQNRQNQHNGTALNLSNFNVRKQNQNFNLSHSTPSPTPSADGKGPEGGDTRRKNPQ